ncbi:MAG: hypothetical protein WA921_04280 [Ahrensia sp.]
MPVSKQLQSDLSGDDIIRDNQMQRDTASKQEAVAADKRAKTDNQVEPGESLSELGRRKKAAPRDAGHN